MERRIDRRHPSRILQIAVDQVVCFPLPPIGLGSALKNTAALDLLFDPSRESKRNGRQKEARADLPQRSHFNQLAYCRIHYVGKQRNHDQDQDRINKLHLRFDPLDPQKKPIHAHRLQHPSGSRLIEDGPEHRHEQQKQGTQIP